MSQLGQRLREIRGTLSTVDVEKGTGIARITVSRYERGENVPSPHNLKRLADFYEIPYKELRTLYYEELFKDPQEREIILEWAKQYLNV